MMMMDSAKRFGEGKGGRGKKNSRPGKRIRVGNEEEQRFSLLIALRHVLLFFLEEQSICHFSKKRRSRIFPSGRDQSTEDGFLDMETVFSLVEDDGMFRLHDFVRDFLASVSGEAVEDFHVGFGSFDLCHIQLIG